VLGRQFVMTRIQKIPEHAVEVEIEKTRAVLEKEGMGQQHLLERDQGAGQFGQQLGLLLAPLLEAAVAKLPFLVPDEADGAGFRDELLPINVVELEGATFDLILDVTPDDPLNAIELVGEQAELEFGIEIFGHDLGRFPQLEDDLFAVLDDRHLVISAAGDPPHQRTVVVMDIDEFVSGASVIEDAAGDDAVWAVGELNEFDHTASGKESEDMRCQYWLDLRSGTRGL
jgi:hypothetical protein